MFNNITSTLLAGDSSEKLIWTLCSVLCGSCLHLNNCVTDQLSTWAQVAGQVSCNIQSIYLILMYRSVVGLHPSLRSWWFVWREGKTLRKHAHYENARKACVSALYSSRPCRSFACSTSKTASYTGYNFDEINEKFRPLPSSPTTPPPHPKSKMGKWRVLPFAQLHP